MATFIENFFKVDPNRAKYASSFRRSTSSGIDMIIVLILRVMTMQICASIWYNKQLIQFLTDFQESFGTETPKSTTAHVQYILGHPIITHTIILFSIIVFVGVVYYTYFNSSKWQATPGKRLMSLRIIRNDDKNVSFVLALTHYLLSITPYIYVLYIAFYKIHNEITFFEAITSARVNLFLGIFFVMWIQIHIFTKKKITFYDMLCKTSWIKEKTKSKYPW